jgi:hypothetical protein
MILFVLVVSSLLVQGRYFITSYKLVSSIVTSRVLQPVSRYALECKKVDQNDLQQWEAMNIDEIFDQLEETDQEDVSAELRAIIDRKVQENAPNEATVRMQLLGINPLVISGFLLAGTILLLNGLLGQGWAAALLAGSEPDTSGLLDGNIKYADQKDLDKLLKLRQGSTIDFNDVYRRIDEQRKAEGL